MMTLEQMVKPYEANTAAVLYWLTFVQGHVLYLLKDLSFSDLSRFFRLDRASTAKGGYSKVRIKMRSAERKALIPQAVKLGPETLLDATIKNKGLAVEKLLTERFTQERWYHDSIPFWMDGDIQIDGKKIQIKMDGAELINEKTILRHFS